MRLCVEAIDQGQTELAHAILATAKPESPDGSSATVAGTIGVALDLLDRLLSGREPDAPAKLAARVRLPRGHWLGERAGREILSLAAQGRSFDALGSLITRQGSHAVQAGAVLALASAAQTWARGAGVSVDQLTPEIFR